MPGCLLLTVIFGLIKNMKLLCHLVHPAHYHLFKHAVRKLEKDGWEILYTIRNKDVLKDLVTSDGYEYINIEDRHRTGLGGYIARLKNLYSACKSFRQWKLHMQLS